ncbi:phosphotransferase [Pseudenhygromyxa sp. WMMC2535]|uniref:PhoU domain-containing protein n=1 Tax=Pseudenhygromyxa sp. WMMC2535 TaxID=2712867 RepID=UPI00155171B3|nr:PhoU domain-containing protein [Pseudenhygromyxa sp. WMMC2535]NVB42458.1 phosphotransferase [Pseudenhygromyxa sp. WMMC2535]
MSTSSEAIAVAGVRENFKFLVLEVVKLLEETQRVLTDPRAEGIGKIAARDDYVDNLKSMIENKCFRLLTSEELDEGTVDLIRAINVSTNNLERIADFAVNIIGQLQYVSDFEVLHRFEPEPFFKELFTALAGVEDALFRRDMSLALAICRSELEIDELYDAVFRQIMDDLRAGDSPENLVTTLFIYRYLERSGDSLLNIGEAAIFATVGEKLKVSEFQALEESLANSEVELDLQDVDYQGIWETRSGSRIGMVHPTDSGGRSVVFKEGRTKKVLEEKLALERWEQLEPGLPPRIFGYHDHGPKASLLLEYLRGTTFQRVMLEAEGRVCATAYKMVTETVGRVWERTFEAVACKPNFMRQVASRLPDVFKVHPEFRTCAARIGALEIPGFEALLRQARGLDAELYAPFRVLIHGDFNTDNIIVNLGERRVHLIDLHRSRPFDYLQDVSVLIVSNFRLKIFDPGPRRRLDQVSREFFRYAKGFAAAHGDASFQARLALGLARSLLTSTRFEMDPEFSAAMALRARYLLERLLDFRAQVTGVALDSPGERDPMAPEQWADFHLDEATLVP